MSDIVDEAKEWEDLEGIEQNIYPSDEDETVNETVDDEIDTDDTDDEIPVDHGKGYKRPPKVET